MEGWAIKISGQLQPNLYSLRRDAMKAVKKIYPKIRTNELPVFEDKYGIKFVKAELREL